MSDHDLSERMTRVERVLFGPEDEPHKGHVTKVHVISENLDQIRELLKKAQWLLLAGIIVALLNLVIKNNPGSAGTQQHTSINTSASGKQDEKPISKREYLTTSEVAEAEDKSVRTITDWIKKGYISPPPIEGAAGWMISPDYRVLPQFSVSGGKLPQTAANSVHEPH